MIWFRNWLQHWLLIGEKVKFTLRDYQENRSLVLSGNPNDLTNYTTVIFYAYLLEPDNTGFLTVIPS